MAWRVRPDVCRVARRFEESEGAGPGPSSRRQDRFIEGVHRTGQEEDCRRSRRSFPSARGSDDSAGQFAIQRTWVGRSRGSFGNPPHRRVQRRSSAPPTVPSDFAQELAELRASVQQLQRENADLRSQLHTGTRCEERERKHPRNLSTPAFDFVPMHRASADRTVDMGQSCQATNGIPESSYRMETLIDNAEASL